VKPSVLILLTTIAFATNLFADEPRKLQLNAPQDWPGEQITLPPSFAKAMQWKGLELIRFAPGMFDPQSESFFSYVIAFQIEQQKPVTQQVLQREFLAYYRGLASAVGKPKKADLDVSQFGLKLKEAKSTRPGATAYTGEMQWVEPFRTLKAQTLLLEADVWNNEKEKRTYVFILVSPNKKDSEIWKQMRGIRRDFFANQPAK